MIEIYLNFTNAESLNSNSFKIDSFKVHFIMVNSTDVAELKYYWKAWHTHTGFEMKTIYMKYIGLLDHMAKLNNFSNEFEYYAKLYSTDGCRPNVDRMYENIRPLYLQLYARVRRILREKFGTVAVSCDGPIPVHLLGSILGQPWTNLLPSLTHERFIHISSRTNAKTPKRLFDQANRFFTSIGMGNLPKSVWSNSMFEENENFADCTSSSWDMYKNNDFRIKMCFRDTVDDVYTMHKQLGLVHYFSAYKIQPIIFQHTSDAAFVDGMINALTLSARYQDHIDRFKDSALSRHSYLLRTAMEKVAVLPFVYATDVWHANAFKGPFAPKRTNDFWWNQRFKYEGVVSPISKSKDKCSNSNYKPFDPSAAYDMLTELPYIRYFLAPVIEFQIFKALCTTCGEYDPKNSKIKHLYECNLRGYKKIGKIISLVMSKGSSTKWQLLFEMIVGHQRLEVEPLLEYFQPLYEQLSLTNNKTNEYIGWKA
uniref:Angiotensin-converting enzyme n=1 Tax=Sipha flava TaxID=143950 RepID=A0A2S2R2E7_9HEMI